MTVLILGGTGEARSLARLLDDAAVSFVSSLAGRVSRPRLPVGPVRIGGFGGAGGLAEYLRSERIRAVVDATHPFAAGISANAAEACSAVGCGLLRLARPGWSALPAAAGWTWVDTHAQAAEAARGSAGAAVFLTTGRQTLGEFVGPLRDRPTLVRVVQPLDFPVPRAWEVLEARGPFDAESERSLMLRRDVGVLVTKDSGGDMTRAKLDVAGELGAEVIVVRRPAAPEGVATAATAGEAARWAAQWEVGRLRHG